MFSLPPGVNGSVRAREWLKRGEFARLFDLCVKEFMHDGYAAATFEYHISGITHFLHWLQCRGGSVSEIDTKVVRQFVTHHLPHCRCAKLCARSRPKVRRALGALLQVLRRQGSKIDPPILRGTVDAELAKYDRYLNEVCGLTAKTRKTYCKEVKPFLSWCCSDGKFESEVLTADAVRAFIHVMSTRRANLHHVAVALRSYFRFKAVGGMQVRELRLAVPETPQWNLARLPKTLSSDETQTLLSSFERATAQGQRDYAIARCIRDLGLRANETALLQLDDIDWRAGTVRIRGKGQREQLLPLPRDLGNALVEYISKFRPRTQRREIFMQLRAPVGPLTSGAVQSAIARAGGRCGLHKKLKGSHVLRHSLAAQLLSRGATLKGIADVLRHESFDTTRIYLKVDLPSLRRVAMPWPGRTV